MTTALVIGVDFGTEGARALLLDASTGAELGSSTASYDHGVITDALPDGRPLPPGWALQNPCDWLRAMTRAIRAVTASADGGGSVVGIGIDFTSCTVLPTTASGTPLCQQDQWKGEPHAWPKLWKHHAAQRQADELTALAARRDAPWLPRYGGRVSSEWLLPKVMQLLDDAPAVYGAAERIVEAGDWIVWQLTGRPVRSACFAGFKALWQRRDGYPEASLLSELRPALADLFASGCAGGEVRAPGTVVGCLVPEWADTLGLPPSLGVATAIIDAHAGILGAGAVEGRSLYVAAGTSTCHIAVASSEHHVPGISGVVQDGIVAGEFAYEAGQAASGDMLGWYADLVGQTHETLAAAAAGIGPGESGLIAVDWWNGCRTPLVDADLSGAILGLTLGTTPAAVYRSLLEATAFGTRLIVETLAAAGLALDRLVVGGGLIRNPLLLRLYADAARLPVHVVGSAEPSARGAALLGAAAAGVYPDARAAALSTAPSPREILEPEPRAAAVYDGLYALYRNLVDQFGDGRSPLRQLALIRQASAPV